MSTRISNEGSLRLSQLMLLAPALHSQVTPDSKADGNLNPDALRRLSEKLSELVGKDAVEGFNQARNEKGEVCYTIRVPYESIESIVLSL